jgi:hypothetical protein
MQTIKIDPLQDVEVVPEGYVNCRCCDAILGYKIHVENVLYLYLYAYPTHLCNNLTLRRIVGRFTGGDLRCSHCGEWQTLILPELPLVCR